ncbi:DUF4270 domain-containing protein [Snuella lapsa]|uniref:DUF4270 domain-containing protein n=1 Tax=Snuella lapsa TaxID=870481 RepID=A0ABP6WYE6_9FLAO
MKKIFKALKFTCLSLFTTLCFVACDKEFVNVKSNVIGEENANFNTDNNSIPILAYNKKLSALQINNLSANLFGVYNDLAYGSTTASIVTQVVPNSFNPDFGENPEIESVILRIPYFSKPDGTDNEGNTTYSIKDSLFGNANAPIKLSIYQNNYFLRDFNPDSEGAQNYFSNGNSGNETDNFALTENATINFDEYKGELLYKDENFTPSSEVIVVTTGEGDDETSERLTPSIRVPLDKAFWETLIFDKEGQPELSNSNNFKNYFRGLHIKAEATGDNGNMVLLDLGSTDSSITINYTKDSTVEGERVDATYVLKFSENRLNTIINKYDQVTLTNGNTETGDDKLYLKGAEGSMAVVELFSGEAEYKDENDNVSILPAIDAFKKTYRKLDENGDYIKENDKYVLKKLINDVQLVIYEDENMPTPPPVDDKDYHHADRIYAFDIKNDLPTIDYLIDQTDDPSNPFNSKLISLGRRFKDDNGRAKYKIRLTEHIKNILLRDSTNTKLGLVLSTNVTATQNAEILNSEDDVKNIPAAAFLTPRGTILHGTKESVPQDRRMRLDVFFTKPK